MNVFRVTGLVALVVSLLAHALVAYAMVPTVALLICNALILAALTWAASRRRRETGGAFDLAFAAETVVAFGVLSLILGLVVALFPLLTGANEITQFSKKNLWAVGAPFLLGLATAGLAPLIAVLMRGWADDDPAADPDVQLAALAQSAAMLAGELGRARREAGALTTAVQKTGAALTPLAADLDRDVKQIAVATAQIAPAIDASLQATTKSIDAELTRLTQSFEAMRARFEATAETSRLQLEQFGASAQAGGASIAGAAAATQHLQQAATDTAVLLDSLGALITSVERFVDARTPQP